MWYYDSISSIEQNPAGIYMVRVLIKNDSEDGIIEQTVFLEYRREPTEQQVINQINNLIQLM